MTAASPDDEDTGTTWEDPDGLDRAKTIRIAQIALVVVALLVVGIVLLTRGGDGDDASKDGGSDATEADGGDGTSVPSGDAAWPNDLQNRPPALGTRGQTADAVQVADGTKPGVYVWTDFDGWHLWVVGGEGVGPISGSITSNDPVAKAVPAVEGRGTVNVNGKVVDFQLDPAAGLTGVDFNPGFYAEKLTVAVSAPDGAPVDPKLVTVGRERKVTTLPFVLDKIREADAAKE